MLSKKEITEFAERFEDIKDVRKTGDPARKSAFKSGWTKAQNKDYKDETLNRLTWDNLGYRFGREYGSLSDDEISYIYEVLAEIQ